MKRSPKRRKTMTEAEVKRLYFCNSKRAPQYIEVKGRRFWWTGIGLVNLGRAHGDEVLITNLE